MEERTYQAFISYRHKPLDIAVAKAIQARLESYRIPANIQRKIGMKKVGRCFRDRDELPTSSDLAHDITEALKNSAWLIVVCTPETPKSKWCVSEIESFIEQHGRTQVLAVLADGEPEESFPEILRFETLPDGTVAEREPLAADLRAGSVMAMKRKLRIEKLRLIAPMLEVAFDDLKRRARERVLRITVATSLAAAIFFAVFGGYTLSQAAVISRQIIEIAAKNDELTEQIAETNRQKDLAQANEQLAVTNEQRARENEQLAKENEARAIVGEDEAKKQAGIAQTNEELAKINEAKALLNETEAKKQAGIALENAELAKSNEELAKVNEAIALTNAAEAQRQSRIALQNESRALTGEAEARRQEGIAKDNEAIAESERDSALIGQSKFLASLSKETLSSGDSAMAGLLALSALPKDLVSPDRPYVTEAETALRNAAYAMTAWKDTIIAYPVLLDAQSLIKDYRLYENLFVAVTNKEIRMWNTKSGELYPTIVLPEQPKDIYIHKQALTVRLYYGTRIEIYELRPDRISIEKSHTTVVLGGDNDYFSGYMESSADERYFIYYQWLKKDYVSSSGSTAEKTTIRMFLSDENTGKLTEIPQISGVYGNIECFDIYGTHVAISLNEYPEDILQCSAYVFDSVTGARLFNLGYYQDPKFRSGGFSPTSICFSPDGSLIATITRGVVDIFDGRTGALVATLNETLVEEDFYKHYSSRAKFSGDGKKIAVISAGNELHIYDAKTGKEQFRLSNDALKVVSMTWYGENILFADDTQGIYLMDPSNPLNFSVLSGVSAPKPIKSEVNGTGTAGIPTLVAGDFSGGETELAVLLKTNEVFVMSTDNACKIPRTVLEGGSGSDILTSNSGRFIAACNTTDLRVFDAQTGELLRTVHVKEWETSADTIELIGWRENDTKLLILETGNHGGRTRPTVMMYDMGADVLTALYEAPIEVYYDKKMISGDIFVSYEKSAKTFYIKDVLTGHTIREIPAPAEMDRCSIQPGGDIIAIFGSKSSEIFIYNTVSGERIMSITNIPGVLYIFAGSVAVCPDGSYLAAVLSDETFAVWETHSGKLVYSAKVNGATHTTPYWSGNSEYVAYNSAGNVIRIYSVRERRVISSCAVDNSMLNASIRGFSPDGSMFTVGNMIFETVSGKLKVSLPFDAIYIGPLKWAGDKRVITEYSGSSAVIWDVLSLEEVMDNMAERLEGRELTEIERRLYYLE